MRTATHVHFRVTLSDWLMNRPWRIMDMRQFNSYLRGELVRAGFDMSMAIEKTGGVPGVDAILSQELA